VEDELAAVFKATGATDTSIRNWGENYSINDGPDSQHKSVEEALKLSAGRVGALYSGYKRSMGRDPDFSFLDQQSVEILRNLPGGKALLDMQANQVKPIAGQTRDVSVLGDMATPAQLRPTPQPPTAGAAPPGATKVVPGPDGKDHWTNDEGTVDLGIKQ
jgi:hypothetical protein